MNTRWVTALHQHPEWADLAAELLFRRGEENLQYAVMQAMMLAYEMGKEGREPPRLKNVEPRKHPAPPLDDATDAVYKSLRALAWSPLTGQPSPPGRLQEIIRRKLAEAAPTPVVAPARAVIRRAVPPPVARRVIRR